MSAGRKAASQCLFWLFLGVAAGVFLAAVLSYHEYQTTAEIAGSIMQSASLAQEPEEGLDVYSKALAKGLKESSVEFREEGREFLELYGYRPMRNWGKYIPYTAGICVLLFQLAGFIIFGIRYRKDVRVKRRIRELTNYLRAVNFGEGAVLCRNEDEFSHLEDEIYKTVMELQSTKETAVKNHEVLAERIADIAHQLKTPLTSMSLMTELLEEYQTGETKEYYNRLTSQIERLKNLVSGLLSLAKLDSHGIVFHEEKLNMSELIEAAAEPFGEIMAEREIVFTVESAFGVTAEDEAANKDSNDCFIYADRQWTEEALMNILKNCVEHTKTGGKIMVTYSQNPIYTELRMEDGGNGFAPKDLPHLFERFYRGEGAAKDNAGIGLALARAVLEQQNGQISAENTADGHASFRVKWYARA